MRLISLRAIGQPLARFASASAVRIALSAILTTAQPTGALQGVVAAPGVRPALVVRPAEPTADGRGAVVTRDEPAPMPGFIGAEPGPGWG
jgi:hypothetical protein